MSTNKPNNVVFIGNIPFDQTEETLKEIFSQVGPIVSFRLIFDHDTNRPKGFAFCEYPDVATAATAVRNLNGYDIGTRQLRVDFSEKQGTGGSTTTSNPQGTNLLPPLPEGKPPPAGVTIPNAISQTLQAYPPQQLTNIISQLKAVSTNNPEQAKQLLSSQPQLAYATFQAMLMMNLVDASVLQQVVASTGQSAQPTAPVPQPAPPPIYRQPPPAQYPPPNLANIDPQRLDLIQRVMSLTDAEINSLAPEQRSQIMALRQQFAEGQF